MTLRTPLRNRLPVLAAMILAAASLFATDQARATAMSDGSASGFLTILGINFSGTSDANDLTLNLVDSLVELDDTFVVGNATATASGSAAPGVDSVGGDSPIPLGLGSTISLSADSTATADPNGLAEALTLTNMSIFMQNLDLDQGTITIDFFLTYNVAANASVGDLSTEDAFSLSSVHIFDDFGAVDRNFLSEADVLFANPDGSSDSGTLAFSLTLLSTNSNTLTMFVDASAIAEAQVIAAPEPAALLLLAIGLVGIAAARRAGTVTR